MEEEQAETISIATKEAPSRIVEAGEKRQYYLFRERDPNYPLEVIITEVPAGHKQPWHLHKTIAEVTVALFGEVVGLTKNSPDAQPEEQPIGAFSFFDPEKHNFHGITAAKDGTILIVLEDKETGEIIGGEDKGFGELGG